MRRQDTGSHDVNYFSMDRSLCYVRKDFNHLVHIDLEERLDVNICFMFPLNKLARKGLNIYSFYRGLVVIGILKVVID